MKAIIDGKRYDTESAKEIATWTNHHYRGDFRRVEETLFVTDSGSYFLHGVGGPMTGYAQPCGGNAYSGGEDIRPMTRQEAFNWCEEHQLIEVIDKYFPDMVQDA